MKEQNYVMCSDDNYFQHLLVAAYSLFKNSNIKSQIYLHVLGNNISKENKNKLNEITDRFNNCKTIIYDVTNLNEKLGRKVNTELSINVYIRLFMTEYLPVEIDKVVYLDVDIIIKKDLSELFEIDLTNKVIAGVKATMDLQEDSSKSEEFDHINSGVLVLNLETLRTEHITEKYVNIINENDGNLKFHDQTIINKAFEGRIYYLHLRYNFTTPLNYLSYRRIKKLYNLTSYYSSDILMEAKKAPAIIHMTSWIMGRAWDIESFNPFKEEYFGILQEINGKEVLNKNIAINKKIKNKLRLFYYKFCPVCIMKLKKGMNKK